MVSQQHIGFVLASRNPYNFHQNCPWTTYGNYILRVITKKILRQHLELTCIVGVPEKLPLDHAVMDIGRFTDAKVDHFVQWFPQTAHTVSPIFCSQSLHACCL